MLTPERVSAINQLRDLFEVKFSKALKTAGKQMEFHELFTEITQLERVLANEFSQRAQVQVEKENPEADIAKREQRHHRGEGE